MEDKLKPCPFCGGDAEIDRETIGMTFEAHCKECTAEKNGFRTEALAIKAWNTRND